MACGNEGLRTARGLQARLATKARRKSFQRAGEPLRSTQAHRWPTPGPQKRSKTRPCKSSTRSMLFNVSGSEQLRSVHDHALLAPSSATRRDSQCRVP